MEQGKRIRRGLVIQGGGAKGAFALGCMKAFQEHGIDFAAVAGTSAGGLCAIIWSTGRVDEGIAAWKEIDHSGFFGRSPDGCLRRLIKVLCIAGKLFVGYVKNIEPEGRQQATRDIVFSLVIGVFAWLLLFDIFPLWGWLLSAVGIPFVALFAFANELPVIGWDNRVRQLMVDAIVFVATTRLLVSVAWLLLEGAGLVTLETRITLTEAIGCGLILAAMRLPVRIQSTLMEGKLLAVQIARFLESDLRIPTYVTVAREIAPNSPHFMLPTPGVFKAHYAALHQAPAEIRSRYAYASAALPFGIFAHAVIGGKIYVDGGVADNTPVLPMGREEIEEIWLICLRPGPFDIREHVRNVYVQTILAEGPSVPDGMVNIMDAWLSGVRIVTLAPRAPLGGLLMGTLNFSERRTNACISHGYRIATRALARRGTDDGTEPHAYRLCFGLLTRMRLLRRALPPCSMWRPFARSDANREALRDFHIPPDVRPPPGEESTAPWVWSVMMVWLLFMTDAFASEHPWARAVWGTLAGLLMIGMPTWWARLKRNLGPRR